MALRAVAAPQVSPQHEVPRDRRPSVRANDGDPAKVTGLRGLVGLPLMVRSAVMRSCAGAGPVAAPTRPSTKVIALLLSAVGVVTSVI
jgi:hypothetical protein